MATKKKTSTTGARIDRRTVTARGLYQQKAPKSKNKPGPWDDIARGVSSAAGAVKRTVISNSGNRNKASNLDKWLNGGNYSHRELTDKQVLSAIGKGAKAVTKGVGKVAKAEINYVKSPSKWIGTKAVKAGAKGAGKAASATANAAGNVAKNTAKGYSNIVKAEQKFVKAGTKTGVKAVKTGAKLLMKPVQPVKTQPMKKRSASSTSTKKK